MLMPIPVWPLLMLSLLMLRQTQGCDLVNFEMAYEELRGIQLGSGSSRGDEQYKWGRGTALRSFQGLLLSGIAAQVSDGAWDGKAAGARAAGVGAAESSKSEEGRAAGARRRQGRGQLGQGQGRWEGRGSRQGQQE